MRCRTGIAPRLFVLGADGERRRENQRKAGKYVVVHVGSTPSASQASVCYGGGMIAISPEAIAASLNAEQREIVLYGPTSFAEADAIPEDLYDEDLTVEEGGDEVFFWTATELGRNVRHLLEVLQQDEARPSRPNDGR
jgi:hypothetical protein